MQSFQATIRYADRNRKAVLVYGREAHRTAVLVPSLVDREAEGMCDVASCSEKESMSWGKDARGFKNQSWSLTNYLVARHDKVCRCACWCKALALAHRVDHHHAGHFTLHVNDSLWTGSMTKTTQPFVLQNAAPPGPVCHPCVTPSAISLSVPKSFGEKSTDV